MVKRSVFSDESKLSAEYLPENLIHRTEILKTMARHFESIFSSEGSSRNICITGPVGTGKTSTTKAFGLWAQARGKKENSIIKYVHINCRRNRTPYMILLAITRELNSHVPTRGYSADELMEMIVELLEVKQSTMLLVLDEIDYAVDRGSEDLLYALTRTSDDKLKSSHRIPLILISRSTNYLSKLDPQTSSSLSAAIFKLNQYTNSELLDIIHERVAMSFAANSVSNESILLTAEIAAIKGDARQALEIIWYAGKFANKEGSSIVYPEHVRFAKANIEPSLLRTALEDMTLHKLLLLNSITRQFRYTQTAYVTTGDVVGNYHIVCEEYGESPRKHVQIWEYLKEFEKHGILVCKKSSTGHRGNTQLISIQGASVSELEQEAIKRIEKMKRSTDQSEEKEATKQIETMKRSTDQSEEKEATKQIETMKRSTNQSEEKEATKQIETMERSIDLRVIEDRSNMSNPVSLAFPERDGQSRDESFIFRTVTHSGAIDLYYLGSAYGDLQYGGDTSEIVMTGIMEDEFNDLVRNSSIVKGQFPLRLGLPGTTDFFDPVVKQIQDIQIRQLVEKSFQIYSSLPDYVNDGLQSEILAIEHSQETMVRYANSLNSSNPEDLDAAKSFLPHLQSQISMFQSAQLNNGYVRQKLGSLIPAFESQKYTGPNFENPYPHYLPNPIPNCIWLMGLKILADDFNESLVIFKTKQKYHISRVTSSHDPYFYNIFYPQNNDFLQKLEHEKDYIIVEITQLMMQKMLTKLLRFYNYEGFRLLYKPYVEEIMNHLVQNYGGVLDSLKGDRSIRVVEKFTDVLGIARQQIKDSEVASSRSLGTDEINESQSKEFQLEGIQALQEQRISDAHDSFSKSLKLNPDNFDTLIQLGHLYLNQKRFIDATIQFQKFLNLYPNNPIGWYCMGCVYRDTVNFVEAEKALKKAIELKPDFYQALNELTVVLGNMNRYSEAEATAFRAIVVNPDLTNTWSVLVEISRITGNSVLENKANYLLQQLNLYHEMIRNVSSDEDEYLVLDKDELTIREEKIVISSRKCDACGEYDVIRMEEKEFRERILSSGGSLGRISRDHGDHMSIIFFGKQGYLSQFIIKG